MLLLSMGGGKDIKHRVGHVGSAVAKAILKRRMLNQHQATCLYE
jgi:hypothetical protein